MLPLIKAGRLYVEMKSIFFNGLLAFRFDYRKSGKPMDLRRYREH